MSRTIKLENDNYLDSSGVSHNRIPLNEILDETLKNVYSQTETKTNRIWIDGKPIYRKVITGTIPNIKNAWASIGIRATDMDVLCPTTCGNVKTGVSAYTPIPKYESSSYYLSYQVTEDGDFQFYQNGYSGRPFTMILEYTKK